MHDNYELKCRREEVRENIQTKNHVCPNFHDQDTKPSNACSGWSVPASGDTLKITFARILSYFLSLASSFCCVMSFQIKYLQRRGREVAPRRLCAAQQPQYLRKPERIFLIGWPVIWSFFHHRKTFISTVPGHETTTQPSDHVDFVEEVCET